MGLHTKHNDENLNNSWLIGGTLATAGVMVAPYFAGKDIVSNIMNFLHGAGLGTGLVGVGNNVLNEIPVFGSTLAEGGIAAATTSGVIGIGGMLLGNYIQKKYDADSDIPWGKIIKYACLTTSILVALPSILTGISVGLTYLASISLSAESALAVGGFIANTLGSAGVMNAATSSVGIASVLTHLFACGGAAMSVAGALFLDNQSPENLKSSDKLKEITEVSAEMVACSPLVRGQKCAIAMRLCDGNGNVLSADDLQTTHTKKLHFMLVDKSLTDYHHIHPEYDSKTGLFNATFTPQVQGEYGAWSDFTLQNGKNIILKNEISAPRGYDIFPAIKHSNHAENCGIKVDIDSFPPLAAGKESMVTIKAVDANGKPAKLQEIMGAYAHLVGFSKDGEHYIHTHPMKENLETGELKFHVKSETDGFSKFFLQLKIDDKELTFPFGQYIQKERVEENKIKKIASHAGKYLSLAELADHTQNILSM